MSAGKVIVGQGFMDVFFELFDGLSQFLCLQLLDNRSGFFLRDLAILRGVDGLEHHGHMLDLASGNNAEHVAVEMHDTALPFDIRIETIDRFCQSQAGIIDHQSAV